MDHFGDLVNGIINAISAARNEKQREAEALSTIAENLFGNVRVLVRELQSALVAAFPGQELSAVLSNWVKTKDGATATLRLTKKDSVKDMKLGVEVGESDVTIDGKPVSGAEKLQVLRAEIERFFTED